MKRMNKLFAALLVGAIGIFGINVVKADDASDATAAGAKAYIKCDDSQLAPGGVTTCYVIVTPNAALAASTSASTTKTVILYVSQSEYLTLSNIKDNTNFKTLTNNPNGSEKDRVITGSYTGALTANQEITLMSFTLTLSKDAENVNAEKCGQLCLTGGMFDSNTTNITAGDTGNKFCPNIVIVKKTCTGEGCNPQTGEFMNYAIIAGVCTVALVAVVATSRKKKFYTV